MTMLSKKTVGAILIGSAIVLLILFTRTINLERTSRFIWDESSQLVDIYNLCQNPRLTLIGPISEDGTKVFGSLTYYMFLPFAVLGKFDPVSPAYGAVFWGALTSIIFILIAKKMNPKIIFPAIIIAIFWYPLVQTARWPWNPNLIPFWISLSLFFFFKKGGFHLFLSGIFLGLSLHHHPLSIFTVAGLWLFMLYRLIRKKVMHEFLSFSLGIFFAVIPFIVFDLMRPPGLFLTRVLYFNHMSTPESGNVIAAILNTFYSMMNYYSNSNLIAPLFTLLIVILALLDIKNKENSRYFIFVWILQIAGVAFVQGYADHYLLPSLAVFFCWLIYKRKSSGNLAKIIIYVLAFSAIIFFPKQISKSDWTTDIPMVRAVTKIITEKIKKEDLKNANLAVLSSPDPNIYGRRFRDLLFLAQTPIKSKSEYYISDNLFVISTGSEQEIRGDGAVEMDNFRNGKLVESWSFKNDPWRLYLFNK
jgi:hypothetical protein